MLNNLIIKAFRFIERNVLYKHFIRKNTNKKIIGIGLQKTGTISLYIFMSWLGYNCKHYVPEIFNKKWLGSSPTCKQNELLDLSMPNLSSYIHKYDFLDDNPFGKLEVIQKIINEWPNTRFICTVREKEDWIQSVIKHINQNYYQEQFEYRRQNYANYDARNDIILTANNIGMLEYMYEVPYKNISSSFLSEYWDNHQNFITKLQEDFPKNVITVDVNNYEEATAKICAFLKIRTPLFFQFPHAKKSG